MKTRLQQPHKDANHRERHEAKPDNLTERRALAGHQIAEENDGQCRQ